MTEDNNPQADTGLIAALTAQPAPEPRFDAANPPLSELAQRAAAEPVTAAVTQPQTANAEGPVPVPPSPPIQFADPAPPTVKTVDEVLLERGLHPSQQVQQPAAAPAAPREIVMGDMRLVERGTEIVLENIANPQPVHQPAPRNERQMSRLELELSAGQKRVAHHRNMQAQRHLLAAKPSATELAAQGQNVPVFRPANVVESGRLKGGTIFPQTHVFAGGSKPQE